MWHVYNLCMITRMLLVASVATALLTPRLGLAAWVCGIDDSLLPQVYALEVIDGKLSAFVGPAKREEDGSFTRSKIELRDLGDWAFASFASPVNSGSGGSCMIPPPDEEWLEVNKERVERFPGFKQNIDVCATGAGKRWGGISFYGGEGSWGVGGIVEEDLESGDFRYYKSSPLMDYSTSHLEYFGGLLWIGTAWYGECGTGMGVGVLNGLVTNNYLYTNSAGTCGFMVSDMVVHSDALWIATELGLSKVELSGSRSDYTKLKWTNYVPTGDSEKPMREVTCGELYGELLQSEELASAPPNDSGYPYGVLWNRINQLRPNFAWQYVRRLNGLESTSEFDNTE